jgi:hypothetical protein
VVDVPDPRVPYPVRVALDFPLNCGSPQALHMTLLRKSRRRNKRVLVTVVSSVLTGGRTGPGGDRGGFPQLEHLIARRKDLEDNPIPAGNSSAA